MMTDNNIPACQFGYLVLNDADFEENYILVKANKILSIRNGIDDEGASYSFVDVGLDENYTVKETVDEILKQIEAIHPSLR